MKLHLPKRLHNRTGATLIVSLMTLFVLSGMAALLLRTSVPRFQVNFQAAGWQQARLAADAGVELALERLNQNAPDPTADTTDWTGWKINSATAANGTALAWINATSVPGVTATDSALQATPPILLDNANVSPVVGTTAVADVSLRALYLATDPTVTAPWARIRSMGTSSLPGNGRAAIDRMDSSLRRLSLRSPMRGTLSANDVLTPGTVPFPNASRIVEVIARPITPFSKAIVTEDSMLLSSSTGWEVNSYDSSDPNKSAAGGIYPGDGSPMIQSNGDIASNKRNPAGSPYGPLIDAQGAVVLGNVSTNGGDDPGTVAHENVTGNFNIDQSRIFDDFDDPLAPPPVPTPTSYNINPAYNKGSYRDFDASGSYTTETYYRIPTNKPVGGLTVKGTGRITIFIDGDWNLNGPVIIPPGVICNIYCKGDINFVNQTVNYDSISSKRPANLRIYGVPDPNADGTLPPRKLDAQGEGQIAAAFYGPSYKASLNGTVNWYGAFAGKSYQIVGGGIGGFHYDEFLGFVGYVKKYVVHSYQEDSRQ